MSLILFIKLIAAAMGGQFIQLLAKSKNIADKKALAKEPHSFWQFVYDDINTVVGAAVFIGILLLVFGEFLNPDALLVVNKTYSYWIFTFSAKSIFNIIAILLMSFFGYSGMDLALRIYSVGNKKANDVLQKFTPDEK